MTLTYYISYLSLGRYNFLVYIVSLGAKGDWEFRISDLLKNPDGTDTVFNPCGEFRWSLEGSVSQIHSPHLHLVDLFKSWRSIQMRKKECGAKSNGKLPHLVIPDKTAALVHGFAVKGPVFGRTSTLIPALAVKDLPLDRTLWSWWWYWFIKINVTTKNTFDSQVQYLRISNDCTRE